MPKATHAIFDILTEGPCETPVIEISPCEMLPKANLELTPFTDSNGPGNRKD
jgi:hypothetical protein